jgi:ATP-dependent protease Clp ATPase subunit
MSDTARDLRCSFCNKTEHDVSQLVAGPRVYICDTCVAIATDIIRHSKRPPSQSTSRVSRWLRGLRNVIVRRGDRTNRSVTAEA